MSEKLLHVILCGHATDANQAQEFAAWSQSCPYVATYFAAGSTAIGLYVLPEEKRWWIELPAEKPELLGLEAVEVFYPGRGDFSSPWSRGEVRPTQPVTPCGSDCQKCPHYRERCAGCPASTFYIAPDA